MSSDLRMIIVLVVVAVLAGVWGRVPDEGPQQLATVAGGSGSLVLGDGTEGQAGTTGGSRVVGGGGQVVSGGGQGGGEGQQSAALEQAKQAEESGEVECAPGKNGGETDTGVTGNAIKLASTMVTSGPGSTFLGESRVGMEAIQAKVNQAGGICGRGLELTLRNDNWEAQLGHDFIKNFINGDVFALPVVPSSEGLLAAGPDIEKAGIPVVGSDGMLIEQYRNDWIWPVATATISQMRIMVDYIIDHVESDGKATFAMVFDNFYKFGIEGADAFEDYVKKKSGATFVYSQGIDPQQGSYPSEIQNVNQKCGDSGCDVMVLLLDPGTADKWISQDANFASRSQHKMGAQPLFTEQFGQNCGQPCNNMLVWTGYNPPLGSNQNLDEVKTFVQDVKAINSGADTTNQFLEGAYLGMRVFVDALEEIGPLLTRDAVRDVMNSTEYESQLANTLKWTADRRFANTSAQAWKIVAPSSFQGFQDARTGWISDAEF